MNTHKSGTTRLRALSQVTLPLLLATSLAAQSRPPVQTPPARPTTPTGQKPTAPVPAPSPTGQQTTFRARSDAYETSVIVRDKSGQFIPTLKAEDFDVFEDGVPQKLVDYWLWRGGRGVNSIVDKAPVQTEGVILPTKAPPVTTSGRVFVIFIDDLHILAANSIKARQVLKDIKAIMHDGDQLAIVSTGYSSIQIDPTLDIKRIDEAIEKTMGGGMTSQEIITAAQTAEGPAQLRHNTHVAFNTAYDILKQLEDVRDKRKAFIYISEGYDFNPYTEARFKFFQDQYNQAANNPANPSGDGTGSDANGTNANSTPTQNPFESGTQGFAEADLIREIDELCRAAKRANTAFYTIDPRGLVAGGDISDNLGLTDVLNHVREQTSSMQVLAEQTGGRAMVNSNDFKGFLARVDAETSDYYLIGWVSTNPDPLKRYRKIEIKVKGHPEYELIYTHDYTIKPIKK